MNELRLENIYKNLDTVYTGRNIVHFQSIGSTSDFAAGLAAEAEKYNAGQSREKIYLNGSVIIAEKQEKGRGRFERNWVSPEQGLWFTIINNPGIILRDLSKITLLTAASVFSVLERIIFSPGINSFNSGASNINLKVKWPNDIYYDGKKLAGILCESEKLNNKLYLYTGIGINVNFSGQDPVFSGLNAVSLYDITGKLTDRSVMLADILNNFEKNYSYFIKTGDFKSILEKTGRNIIL